MIRKVALVLVCALACVFFSAAAEEDPDVTVIAISDESVAYREKLFSDGSKQDGEAAATFLNELLVYCDSLDRTEEEWEQLYEEEILPVLKEREQQSFPDIQLRNALAKETLETGDLYTLTGEKEDVIVFYIHGGAWVCEISEEHVSFCDKIVDALGAKVYMPLYPLAPLADWQDGYEMLEEAYEKALSEGKPIIIMGDSAGGNLTLGFTLKLKDEGKTMPEKVVVIAPCVDISFSNPEIAEYAKVDGMLPPTLSALCGEAWANGEGMMNFRLSPLYGDYVDFPETMIIQGTYDILCPDVMKLYDVMQAAGVETKLVIGEGFWHVFPIYAIGEQDQVIGMIADFCAAE